MTAQRDACLDACLDAAAVEGLRAVRAVLDLWGLFGPDRIAALAYYRARGAS